VTQVQPLVSKDLRTVSPHFVGQSTREITATNIPIPIRRRKIFLVERSHRISQCYNMSRQSARPKRAAEDYVRTHETEVEHGGPSKKPRFDIRNPSALAPDALEEDATLDADVIGGRGQQVRRNAVNIDGYDSDSDNEGFDAKAEAKARNRKVESKEEVESDMFADLAEDFKDGDDSEGDETRRGKKKAVRFLDEDEIEGQIQDSKSGGHVSADFSLNGHANGKGKGKAVKDNEVESSTDSDVDDEVRAEVGEDVDEEVGAGGKKTHAPKLDAFNMRSENEEGRFDDQGNFVRKAADPDAIHDTWLEGLSKKDMKKAKEAADKRDQDRRRRNAQDDAILTSDVLKKLIPMLERSETVLEALARLGKGKDRKPKWQNKHRNRRRQDGSTDDIAMGEEEDSAEVRRKEAVEAITAASDLLLTRGQPEIYDTERELLIRQYRKETGEDWVEPDPGENGHKNESEPKMWEYRWSDARDGGEIYGPYEGSMMAQWNDAGYFGEGVEFRRTPGEGKWTRVAGFV
jgi:CD2 antigen cytoplasmic tail-binding protein 2